jgi:hypothetical protein
MKIWKSKLFGTQLVYDENPAERAEFEVRLAEAKRLYGANSYGGQQNGGIIIVQHYGPIEQKPRKGVLMPNGQMVAFNDGWGREYELPTPI